MQEHQLFSFDEIASSQDQSVGSKAYNLAILKNAGFTVPESQVAKALPNETDWKNLLTWWSQNQRRPLVVRSSAFGEDGDDASFAGQLTTFLNIQDEAGLRQALRACFESRDRAASQAYQAHFGRTLKGMNVVIQEMLDAQFSGVFFSRDPRGQHSWLIEMVPGFGEALVSGHVTPFQFSLKASPAETPEGWSRDYVENISQTGLKVAETLGFAVDMEWVIDRAGRLWVVQARPITAMSEVNAEQALKHELQSLKQSHSPETVWDGNTFAEWTGLPTPLSFSIWQRAFSQQGAFGAALTELGYQGYDQSSCSEEPLLENIFGRAMLNLNRLNPYYFGKIPYHMVSSPHPHLEFSWSEIDLESIAHAPKAIWQMLRVAWKMQTQQEKILLNGTHELAEAERSSALNEFEMPQSTDSLVAAFLEKSKEFSEQSLKWPFALAMSCESTLQTLETVLAKDLGQEGARRFVQTLMQEDLVTVTLEMERAAHLSAQLGPDEKAEFLNRYGHRGPGELDLANPRWSEKPPRGFAASSKFQAAAQASETNQVKSNVWEKVQGQISSLRLPYAQKEWQFLKDLLQLRERWKMHIMKPYFDLRRLALRLGEQTGFGDQIFWLNRDEIAGLLQQRPEPIVIVARQKRAKQFQSITLPSSFSLKELEQRLLQPEQDLEAPDSSATQNQSWAGEPLSPGVREGWVRLVTDPSSIEIEAWPAQTVLVAVATDPGWTPLFEKACAIVVERGGVLSHCAIVAREMGIPAVSQILGCTKLLKDGDYVRVDGNRGRVAIARNTTSH